MVSVLDPLKQIWVSAYLWPGLISIDPISDPTAQCMTVVWGLFLFWPIITSVLSLTLQLYVWLCKSIQWLLLPTMCRRLLCFQSWPLLHFSFFPPFFIFLFLLVRLILLSVVWHGVNSSCLIAEMALWWHHSLSRTHRLKMDMRFFSLTITSLSSQYNIIFRCHKSIAPDSVKVFMNVQYCGAL